MGVGVSVADKLTIAAYGLEEAGQRPFSAEDLVVAAWRAFPDAFGLAGQLDPQGASAHPDSNRVFMEIMGAKPIRRKGYLEKVGNKTYQLTETGRAHARSLLELRTADSSKTAISREAKSELRHLLTSRAFTKWSEQRSTDITFLDACAFWGISPRSSAIELAGRVAHVRSLLDLADSAFRSGNVSLDHAGEVLSPDKLRAIRDLSSDLLDRFHRDLEVIRRRTDERL